MAKRYWFVILFIISSVLSFYAFIYFQMRSAGSEQQAEWLGKDFPRVQVFNNDGKSTDIYQELEKASKGKKFLALSLWATWCVPCVAEMETLREHEKELNKRGLGVVLVNYDPGYPDKTIPMVKKWLRKNNFNFESFFDFEDSLLENLEIIGLPYAIFLGPDLKIRYRHMGAIDWGHVDFSLFDKEPVDSSAN